jgi:hypothetical protein
MNRKILQRLDDWILRCRVYIWTLGPAKLRDTASRLGSTPSTHVGITGGVTRLSSSLVPRSRHIRSLFGAGSRRRVLILRAPDPLPKRRTDLDLPRISLFAREFRRPIAA